MFRKRFKDEAVDKFYDDFLKQEKLEQLQEIAKSRGGALLSTEYKHGQSHLTWKCKRGHIWEATPNNVKNVHTWCPKCSRIRGIEKNAR